MSEVKEYDISCELSRKYQWYDPTTEMVMHCKIDNPLKLYIRAGGSTHRVWNGEEVFCIPGPGYFGCVLSWVPKDKEKPVSF